MVYVLFLGEYDANKWLIKVGAHGFGRETQRGFYQRQQGHRHEFRAFRREMKYLFFILLDADAVAEAERSAHEFCRARFQMHRKFREVYVMPPAEIVSPQSSFRQHLVELRRRFRGHGQDLREQLEDSRRQIVELENRLDELRRMMVHTTHTTATTTTTASTIK